MNENVRMYRRVLAILPRRTEECYVEFLRLLLEAAVNVHGIVELLHDGFVQWKRVMCDFELSIRSGFLYVATHYLHIVDFEVEG